VTDWRERAACRGRPTRIWFSDDALEQAIALAVCRTCPVREPCRAEGMGEWGVWGATTAWQRWQRASLGRQVA
jgi:Transcription factor WhiB